MSGVVGQGTPDLHFSDLDVCVDITGKSCLWSKQKSVSERKVSITNCPFPSNSLIPRRLFISSPLGVFGRKRYELDSPNLGGHFQNHPTPCNNLPLRRREMGCSAYLKSDLRTSRPLKRSQPPQTGLRSC
ncbi:hypothetical protein AVEN_263283-1 [Araneus ventricosus]|uniref:Uncharacterized protein n=1 Tax=Araneus ventricosus TaxID=182803 RepID=A0A4Y2HHA4_ARAVE|nr:hypothetical protein AVEN_263283-1 [Araneus ventricosus]